MYAAVRRYEGILDDAEAARLVRDSFLPQLDDIPGFETGYRVLSNSMGTRARQAITRPSASSLFVSCA